MFTSTFIPYVPPCIFLTVPWPDCSGQAFGSLPPKIKVDVKADLDSGSGAQLHGLHIGEC
jgi:hypothetical protein